jgi:3-deoxy-D-arabino-heptulosonate 7-phosphate (DAHP) synthase
MVQVKAALDESIRAVFDGRSDKFILVIGPCSADHSEPVLAYISRLRRIQEQVSDKIIIIPRIYTNKPRTTGQGYKGMLHQPDPEAKPDMYKGIVHSRNENPTIKRLVKGLMIESYLEDGSQSVHDHVFGKSITDPCLGWEKTEQLIFDIADKL